MYFEDKEPVENIHYLVPAKRIRCFTSDDSEVLGGLRIGIGEQYSMEIKSNVGVIGLVVFSKTTDEQRELIETGYKAQDVVCVTKDGVENLTNYPRKLFEIDC